MSIAAWAVVATLGFLLLLPLKVWALKKILGSSAPPPSSSGDEP